MRRGIIRAVALLGLLMIAPAGHADTLLITAAPNEAPYTDSSKPDGGVATRKVMATFRAMGETPDITWLPWHRGLAETERGSFAATFPYLKTPERERLFYYSDPIYHDETYLWTRSTARLSIDDRNSLTGKTICVPKDYASPLLTILAAPIAHHKVKVEQPESQEKCVRMLSAGQVDMMSGQEFEIGPMLAAMDGIVHSPNPIRRLAFHVLFSRKSDHAAELVKRFNLALAQITQAEQSASDRESQNITVITEEFPPYQYSDHGKVTGMTSEVVRAVLDEAGISAPITIMPWARAYRMAKEQKNVLLFSLARTPERETLFQWIGQVNEAENFIYARADRKLTLSSLDDARRYLIGTVVGDIRESYFLERGFSRDKGIQSARQHEQNYEMLRAGRIDLWPTTPAVMAYIVRKAGDDPSTAVIPVWRLDDLHVGYSGDFLVASLATPTALAERLRVALDRIKSDGRFDAIKMNWER